MKNINDLFKQAYVVVSAGIAVAIILAVVITLFVIVPFFSSWQQGIEQNAQTQLRLEKIENNLSAVESLDTYEIEALASKLDLILPSEDDTLRFFTLAEKVAQASGMKVSAAQAEVKVPAPQVSTPPPSASDKEAGEAPSPSTGGGTAATGQSGQVSTGSGGGSSVKISFIGSFPSLLKLLANFEKADRAALITSLSITEDQEKTAITAAIDFSLPLSKAGEEADAENIALINRQEISSLQTILEAIVFTASPAKGPVGKTDPFK